MDLNSILVSEFAKITNDNKETVNEGTTVYGTYRVDGDGAYVQIDGSDTRTPVVTTASAKSGDRVTVLIKNHRAIITGNMTDPSASSETVRTLDLGLGGLNDTIRNVSNSVSDLSGEVDGISTQVTGMAASIEGAEKVATNFLSFEDPYGLIVGNLTGSTLGFNVLIDATSVNMRYNSTILAKYASNTIYLGYNNTNSVIDMCGGLGTIAMKDGTTNWLNISSLGSITLNAEDGICSMRNSHAEFYADSSNINIIISRGSLETGIDISADGNITLLGTLDVTKSISCYSSISGSSLDISGTGYFGNIGTSKDHPNMVHSNNFCVHTSTKTSNAYCGFSSDGYLQQYSGSSKRYKHGFHSLSEDLKEKFRKLYDLEVKSWTYNDDYLSEEDELYQTETYGLIAEDVSEVLPEAVVHDKEGNPDNYRDRHILNATLVLLQEQKKSIDSLESRIEALEKKEV